MSLEIYELVASRSLLSSAKKGSKGSIKSLRNYLNGIRLQYHDKFTSQFDDPILITLREACDLGIVDSVRIENRDIESKTEGFGSGSVINMKDKPVESRGELTPHEIFSMKERLCNIEELLDAMKEHVEDILLIHGR